MNRRTARAVRRAVLLNEGDRPSRGDLDDRFAREIACSNSSRLSSDRVQNRSRSTSDRAVHGCSREPGEPLGTAFMAPLRFGGLGRFGRSAILDQYFISTGRERTRANHLGRARRADGVTVFVRLKFHTLSDAKLGLDEQTRGFGRNLSLNTFKLLACEQTIQNRYAVFADAAAPWAATSIIQ